MPNSKLKQFGLVMTGVVAGVVLSLNFSANADKLGPQPLPVDEMRAFADVFNVVKRDYVEPVEDKSLFTHAITGMLSGLDPHSAYLDPDALKALQVGTQGEFGGLGIEVSMEDGFVKVVSPIEDTPAFRAGIKAGDLIIKIDDTLVKGMTLDVAVKRLRGKPQTKVTLTLARKGVAEPVVVKLTREVVKVKSVKSSLVEPGYGYMRVTQFQENTANSVVEQLGSLGKASREGRLKGLVLDLRNDPGGLLNGAVGVASAFLPEGVAVVSTNGRTEGAQREYRASSPNDFLRSLPVWVRQVPMVVLVNGGSASGALQDHKRATIMGTRTFGKGSVQTILPLNNNHALKLTTARYYTPAGRSIQAKGIDPDIVIEEFAEGGSARRLRESDLIGHLGNDRDPDAENAANDDKKPETAANAGHARRYEFGSKDDYQLVQALNKLKGLPVAASKPAPDAAEAGETPKAPEAAK